MTKTTTTQLQRYMLEQHSHKTEFALLRKFLVEWVRVLLLLLFLKFKGFFGSCCYTSRQNLTATFCSCWTQE